MEAGEEKGGWETGFYFLIFTDIVKMGWDTKPARNEGKKSSFSAVVYITESRVATRGKETRCRARREEAAPSRP